MVEDDPQAAAYLKGLIDRFREEEHTEIDVTWHTDAVDFLEKYEQRYDRIFMDIELPFFNGMDAARRIREKDSEVVLIFITNMARYAIHGYEVDALDFFLKPVQYARFRAVMKKTIRRMKLDRGSMVMIRTADGISRVPTNSVLYLEVIDHLVYYHLSDRVLDSWTSLKAAEKDLPAGMFVRCNKSMTVNLHNVTRLEGDQLLIGDEKIAVSKSHRKEVLSALNLYHSR